MTGHVIDPHAHVVLEDAFGCAGTFGPDLSDVDGVPEFRVGRYTMRPAPYRGSVFMDADERERAMARHGIDRQMLSPNPLTFFGGIDVVAAAEFAAATNTAMSELVGGRPHLLGAAQVPLQDVAAACRETERAAELGLSAVYAGTDYGLAWDDRALAPFFDTLVACDLPLFIHAATNDGDGPTPDRLRRHGLDLVAGYTAEETIVAATFVLGGVLDRHAALDVCLSHGGGAVALLTERFDSMLGFRGKPAGFAQELSRLWFDAHVGAGRARELLVDTVGTERLVYGTNFGGWDTPDHADDFAASLTPNAERLLRLTPGGSNR